MSIIVESWDMAMQATACFEPKARKTLEGLVPGGKKARTNGATATRNNNRTVKLTEDIELTVQDAEPITIPTGAEVTFFRDPLKFKGPEQLCAIYDYGGGVQYSVTGGLWFRVKPIGTKRPTPNECRRRDDWM